MSYEGYTSTVVRPSVTHLAVLPLPFFLLITYFDVICDLLLNRGTATCNLLFEWSISKGDTNSYRSLLIFIPDMEIGHIICILPYFTSDWISLFD